MHEDRMDPHRPEEDEVLEDPAHRRRVAERAAAVLRHDDPAAKGLDVWHRFDEDVRLPNRFFH
jgi:hypothetical protein